MSSNELTLFKAFVAKSERYVEFGSGGSTVVATSLVKSCVVSVDSSRNWLDNVEKACEMSRIRPKLVFTDIGPTGDWGYPTDTGSKIKWKNYYTDVWELGECSTADLYFVDGRFRVACFAQIVLKCRSDAIIGFHDFGSRGHYHPIKAIAREIAAVEEISFFQPHYDAAERATFILQKYSQIPA